MNTENLPIFQNPAETPPRSAKPPFSQSTEPVWIFSRAVDLAVFLGTALVAVLLVAAGRMTGWLNEDAPEWSWWTSVLLVDVAHVYATVFRVSVDSREWRRRRWAYALTALIAWIIGAALYSESAGLFWSALAYLAVFHFVRQQYGWVAIYRSRAGERDRLGWWIDAAAIYLATIGPLIHWHAHLPRRFHWFLAGDFIPIPEAAGSFALAAFWMALTVYFGRSFWRRFRKGFRNPGKDIVVATTACCWYVGIVAFDSDFAFTVTNVLIHGVPYLVLVYWYRWERPAAGSRGSRGRAILIFLATVWLLAYVEELLWDRSLWHERAWAFGTGWTLGELESLAIPALAIPQITHYLLDAVLWRRRSAQSLHQRDVSPASAASPERSPVVTG